MSLKMTKMTKTALKACRVALRSIDLSVASLAKPELLSLGVTNSLYEAALHVFVFVWTPALERRGPRMLATP